jgi:hypothetical protein
MSHLRRALLLAAVAIGGISLLAPLAARSAAPVLADAAEHLIAASDTPRLVVLQRGTLSGRQRTPAEAAVISNGSENLSGEARESPPQAPMEATLFVAATAAPPRAAPPPGTDGSDSVWDDLARCESGGNWAIDSGNGYYGGLQFSHETWHNYGGGEFAEFPHEATREEQIIVAERLRAARGYAPWPACRAELGLP